MATIFGNAPTENARKRAVTYGKSTQSLKRARVDAAPGHAKSAAIGRARVQIAGSGVRPDTAAKSDIFDLPSSDSEADVSAKVLHGRHVEPLKARAPADRNIDAVARPKPTTGSTTTGASLRVKSGSGSGPKAAVHEQKLTRHNDDSKAKVKPGTSHPAVRTYARRTQARAEGVVSGTGSLGPKAAKQTLALRQDSSAPAKLTHMVEEPFARSHLCPENYTTNHDHPTSSGKITTPERPHTASKRASSLTPKQSQLWNQLLDPVAPARGSSTLSKGMKTSGRNDSKSPINKSTESSAGNGPQRVRLADRLKQDSQVDESFLSSDAESGNSTDTETYDVDAASQSRGLNSQLSTSTKQTYAQTRSYLQEVSMDDALLIPLTDEMPRPRDDRANITDEFVIEPEEEPSQGLRNVHALRAAGNKKRFQDDMDLLMEDVQDRARSSWSRRRSALMELSTKLRDLDFAGRFCDGGFVVGIVRECKARQPFDAISDSVLLVIASQLARIDIPRQCIEELQPVIAWIFQTGATETRRTIEQIAKDRSNNMSKASKDSYIAFMSSSSVMSTLELEPTSVAFMDVVALRTLQAVILKLRTSGHHQTLLGNPASIQKLLTLFTQEDSAPHQVLKGRCVMSVLEAESLSIAIHPSVGAKLWTQPVIKGLIEYCSSLLASATPDMSILSSTLRLLLNLTNGQPVNCALFATHNGCNPLLQRIGLTWQEATSCSSADDNVRMDTLLLSLGLAINLAEHSDSVRFAALPRNGTMLEQLVRIFVQGRESTSQADSLEQSRANVAHGYLAVLLGNLCLNDQVKTVVEKQMGTLGTLIDAVEEFVGYHRRVDDESQREEGGGQAWQGFTDRLEIVLEKMRGP